MYSLLVHIAAFSTMVIYFALISIPYVLIQFLPEKRRAHCMRALVLGMGKCVIYIAMRPFVKIKYTDAAGGIDVPAIYVCNHRSGSDAFLMAAFDKEAMSTAITMSVTRQWNHEAIARHAMQRFAPGSHLRTLMNDIYGF